jgi:hypothetical protein
MRENRRKRRIEFYPLLLFAKSRIDLEEIRKVDICPNKGSNNQ